MRLIKNIKLNLSNIPGWTTNRKIIVFESDDWGSIRMPSNQAYISLLRNNIKVDNNDQWYLDCLETGEDLQNLFTILFKYKDRMDNFPVFTMNTVMGNPDFEKIKNSNFESYYYEHFFDSYKRYHGTDMHLLWEQGFQDKLIKPQFHAREHINVPLWMNDLQRGYKETRIAFDHEFFGLLTETSSVFQRHYLAAYRAESSDQLHEIEKITKDGLQLFEDTFGFRSTSFIACNYIWPTALESFLIEEGINQLQSQRGQLVPDPYEKGRFRIKRHYMGQKNSLGQMYTVRNVRFEPFQNDQINEINNTLKEIQLAFFWQKPAIISTHRINYVGGIDGKHRDRNLKALDELLENILIKWPDVIFMTSDQLGAMINNHYNS